MFRNFLCTARGGNTTAAVITTKRRAGSYKEADTLINWKQR